MFIPGGGEFGWVGDRTGIRPRFQSVKIIPIFSRLRKSGGKLKGFV